MDELTSADASKTCDRKTAIIYRRQTSPEETAYQEEGHVHFYYTSVFYWTLIAVVSQGSLLGQAKV